MLVVELSFPAGRYHANPWGRHVNEGVAEWPPSPYRLIRALFDAWKRKRPEWEEARVERVLAALASDAPSYWLPPATVSHTRSYLDKNSGDVSDKTLIFDGFVAVSRRERVLMGWPALEADPELRRDLDELLDLVNYLGRSESWVAGRVIGGVSGVEWNCEPADGAREGDEIVTVACAVARTDYRGKSWMTALTYSTDDLLKQKASGPPAMKLVEYARASDCFRIADRRTAHAGAPVEGVLYALSSKVLPRSTETLEVAEWVRKALMSNHKYVAGGPEHVSPRFSGKDESGRPLGRHEHAFVLPLDQNEDGKLDHVLVFCREPLNALEIRALDRLQQLRRFDGRPDIDCVPIQWGTREKLLGSGTRFRSTTPFVTPRHYRKGRGDWVEWMAGEIARECANHGLSAPLRIEPVERRVLKGGRGYRWLEFRRNRKDDPARLGYGFELEFAEPVQGPFTLGYGCHFGLGQFQPVGD